MKLNRLIFDDFDFYEEYCIITNHLDKTAGFDGYMFETYGEEIEYVKNASSEGKQVWTLVDGDNDGMYILSGFHVVNRFGYFIGNEKVSDSEQIEILL